MIIPQPRFLLKEPKSKSATQIYVHIRFARERVVLYLNERQRACFKRGKPNDDVLQSKETYVHF